MPKASDGGAIWWTFGGSKANTVLAHHLRRLSGTAVTSDSLTITWDADLATAAEQAAAACKLGDDATHWTWSSEAEEALKFAELLPPQLRRRIFVARIMDSEALAVMSAEPVRVVAGLPIEIEDL